MPKKSLAEERMRQVPKKSTIVKTRVGCVKTSVYDLPDNDFVYGKKSPPDPEGAGDILSTWETINPSTGKESIASVVHQNVLAVKHGCITASSMYKYAKEHQVLKLKEQVKSESARIDNRAEGPFGRKTEFANDTFEDIIQAKFTNYVGEDNDYPLTKGFVMHGFMPPPKPTRSSELQVLTRKLKQEEENRPERKFVMKRFQKIPGSMITQSQLRKAAKNSLDSSGSFEPES